jgi:hypothetical protein
MCGTARRGADALPTAQGTGGDYGPPAESGIQDGFFCLSNFGLAFCRRRYVAARSVEPYAHFAVTLTGDEWNRPVKLFDIRGGFAAPLCLLEGIVPKRRNSSYLSGRASAKGRLSLGLIPVIILIIFLLGGFSGRFGGYGYGYGHGGVGLIGIILIILVVLLLMGRI